MFRVYLHFIRLRHYSASVVICILALLLASCSAGSSAGSRISPPASIAISAPQSPVLVGDTGQLSAKVTLADGSSEDITDQAIWQTSSPAIAKLEDHGTFAGQSVGTTTVTAGYSGLAATTSVSVMDHFTVIAIPDTQNMVAQILGGSLAMMQSEFNWIGAHQFSDNIRLVAGEGDIVDSGDSIAQWSNADSMYRIIDEAGIPYAPVIGNHDYDIGGPGVGANRASHNYNQYFGAQRFAGRPWYGQSGFPPGQSDNFYVTFDVGARHYMVLALEFLPRPEAIPWAQSILDAHPGYQVILLTHAYLNDNGAVNSVNDYPDSFSFYGLSAANATDGNQLWDTLISKNSSIIAVLCGHTFPAQATLDNADNAGDPVAQIKADYQGDNRGGSGTLRIMKFYPGQNRIDVSSYSPYFDQWLADTTNQFTTFYGQGAKPAGQRLTPATR